MACKILLADDRYSFRQSFRQSLAALPDARLSMETGDLANPESMALIANPDLMLVNLNLSGVNGLNLINSLCEQIPNIQIIAISRQDDEAYILELFRRGARGFLTLSADAEEAVLAVRHVMHGVRYVSPVAADRLFNLLIERTQYFSSEPYQKLTRREREVFHLTAEGFSGPEIAARLTISPRTVELHRSNLMRKLGLNSLRDLIRYAVQSGALPLDEGNQKT